MLEISFGNNLWGLPVYVCVQSLAKIIKICGTWGTVIAQHFCDYIIPAFKNYKLPQISDQSTWQYLLNTKEKKSLTDIFHWSILSVTLTRGRAMAQVVSRRPLTAETGVRARVNLCRICDGQSGTGTRFSPSSSVFPYQYIIPSSLSKLTSSGECVIC
jgi:hypothetical protein